MRLKLTEYRIVNIMAKYYRYLTKHRSIHILFKLIQRDYFSQKIKVLRVWKTTPSTEDTIRFVEGRTELTESMWDGFLREENLRKVSNKAGRLYEKRLKNINENISMGR